MSDGEGLPHDELLKALQSIINRNYVHREKYEALKHERDALQEELLRSRKIFEQKLKEWGRFKQLYKARPCNKLADEMNYRESSAETLFISSTNSSTVKRTHSSNISVFENKASILAPKLQNKATKRLIQGGNTPPDFWTTKFTPEPNK
jgi:hypothetical protein